MVGTLQDLTGRESGIVVYDQTGILCSWTAIDGLPMIAPTGILGTGDPIPEAAGEHAESLAPYLEGVDVTIAVSDYSEETHPLTGGTVYDLGNDVLVIAPNGWI